MQDVSVVQGYEDTDLHRSAHTKGRVRGILTDREVNDVTVTTYFSLLDAVRLAFPPRALAGYPSSIFMVGIDHSSFSSPPRISPQNEISRVSTPPTLVLDIPQVIS